MKIVKKTNDDRYVFEKDGMYFTMKKEQADMLITIINEFEEAINENNR